MLGGANAEDIAGICRHLDGLPLAIELAAARVRVFAPATLRARLERRLPLLIGGPQDVPERHRTLAAAISWSYELLHEPELNVFRNLSVFAGGFTLDAAQEVTGCDDAAILALADHSLLHTIDTANVESRFAMLDTVREFAFDRLVEHGEESFLRSRHAAWCQSLVTQANAALGTARQQQWLRALDTEHDNLRAAMHAARVSDDGSTCATCWRSLEILVWAWVFH